MGHFHKKSHHKNVARDRRIELTLEELSTEDQGPTEEERKDDDQ